MHPRCQPWRSLQGCARGDARGKTVISQCGEACLAQLGGDIAFVRVAIAGERVNDNDGGIVIFHLFGKAESGLNRHRSGRSLSRQKLAHVAVSGRLKRDCGRACLQRLTMSSRGSVCDRRHQYA
jgi:hypothetical protein